MGRNRNPPPAPPAANRARAPTRSVPPGNEMDNLINALGRASINTQFAPYNFNFRFPILWNVAGPLSDGRFIVYADYYTPTLHATRFNSSVDEEGLITTLTMEIPRTFADVGGRAEAGEHAARGTDEMAFILGARETTHRVAANYPNLDSIVPSGQQDPLPFRCQSRTHITQIYHDGDDRLNNDIVNDPIFQGRGFGLQFFPFLRVAFISLEAIRVGGSSIRLNNQVFTSPRGRTFDERNGANAQPPQQPYPMRGGGHGGVDGDGRGGGGAAAAAAQQQAAAHQAQREEAARWEEAARREEAFRREEAARRERADARHAEAFRQWQQQQQQHEGDVPGAADAEHERERVRANNRVRTRGQYEEDEPPVVENADEEEDDEGEY